jgi:hypothetical protein
MKFQNPTPAQLLILRFLRVETCTTPEIIQILLGQKSIQAGHQILGRMVQQKLLTKHNLSIMHGRAISLFGITHHGLAFAWNLDETPETRPTFQPSKISALTLQHRLDIQKIHIITEQNGWTVWRDGSQLGFRGSRQKIPDAIAVSPDSRLIAFEIEREIKSTKRYKQIILSHLQGRKKGNWDSIMYLCPSSDMAYRLRRVFQGIGTVDFNGRKLALSDEHLRFFQFFGYADFIKNIKNISIY